MNLFNTYKNWEWNQFNCHFLYLAAVQIIHMPSKSDANNDFAGQLSTISGWGKNSDREYFYTCRKYLHD